MSIGSTTDQIEPVVKRRRSLLPTKIRSEVEVNARKTALRRAETLRLTHEGDEICVVKGKRVIDVNLKSEKPDGDTLAGLLRNSTGNPCTGTQEGPAHL